MNVQKLRINGEDIYVEVEPLTGEVPPDDTSSGNSEFLSTEQGEGSDIGDTVKRKLTAVVASVKGAMDATAPAEWSVEIGMTLEASAGVIFAAGKTSGNVEVKATWKRQTPIG